MEFSVYLLNSFFSLYYIFLLSLSTSKPPLTIKKLYLKLEKLVFTSKGLAKEKWK